MVTFLVISATYSYRVFDFCGSKRSKDLGGLRDKIKAYSRIKSIIGLPGIYIYTEIDIRISVNYNQFVLLN